MFRGFVSGINIMSHVRTPILCLYHASCLMIDIISCTDQWENVKIINAAHYMSE